MTGIQHIRVIKHEEGSESFIGNRLYDHAISPFRVAFFRTFMAYRVPASLPQVLRTRKTWEVERSAIQIMLEIEMALTVVVTFPNDPWPNTLSSSNCAGDALSHPSLVSSRTSISCSSLEPLAEVWNKSFFFMSMRLEQVHEDKFRSSFVNLSLRSPAICSSPGPRRCRTPRRRWGQERESACGEGKNENEGESIFFPRTVAPVVSSPPFLLRRRHCWRWGRRC